MITIDVHSHTRHSHGQDSVLAMAQAAKGKGLSIYGFSEHSPRPEGCSYPIEYRERLKTEYPVYVEQVQDLCHNPRKDWPRFLLGVEMDWFDSELDFIKNLLAQYPYNYVVGGLHFLGTWGFDGAARDWENLSQTECSRLYTAYYQSLTRMVQSGLVNIAAHPDLIKIFSIDHFRTWLVKDNLDLVRDALAAMRANGVAMEISSAGLRKPCAEIYPGPVIMSLAADIGVDITFASDAHCVEQVAWKFDELAAYAQRFGYARSVLFEGNHGDSRSFVPFA